MLRSCRPLERVSNLNVLSKNSFAEEYALNFYKDYNLDKIYLGFKFRPTVLHQINIIVPKKFVFYLLHDTLTT